MKIDDEIRTALFWANLDLVDPEVWGRVYSVPASVIELGLRVVRDDLAALRAGLLRGESPERIADELRLSHDVALDMRDILAEEGLAFEVKKVGDEVASAPNTAWREIVADLRKAYEQTHVRCEPVRVALPREYWIPGEPRTCAGTRVARVMLRYALRFPNRVFSAKSTTEETVLDEFGRKHEVGRRVLVVTVRSGDVVALLVTQQDHREDERSCIWAPWPTVVADGDRGEHVNDESALKVRPLDPATSQEWVLAQHGPGAAVTMTTAEAAEIAAGLFDWSVVLGRDASLEAFQREFFNYTGSRFEWPEKNAIDYVDELGAPLFDLAGAMVIDRFMKRQMRIRDERDESERRVLVKGQRYGDDYNRFRRRRSRGV